jgi:release factor glutamine methyltransferase
LSAAALPRTCREALALGREFLARKSPVSDASLARLEAELLLAHALGLDRLKLYLALDAPIEPAELALARELFVRRSRGEPVAYLTGLREFYGRPFAVDARVLVPRPETELLVDLARAVWKARAQAGPVGCVADFGTGSGCLAISLALELERARVWASDVSAPALELARANARRLGAEVEFLQGDGPEALRAVRPAAGFDLLVSNPPYVTREERAALSEDVRAFEPELALFAPAGDPNHWVRRLCTLANELLNEGGTLLVELDPSRAAGARELARAAGLQARVHRDLVGLERVLEASRVLR